MAAAVETFCGRENFSVDETEISEILNFLRGNASWDFPAGTLSVAFFGDDEICRMHEEFLGDPTKTDVITFPGDEIFSAPRPRKNSAGVPADDDNDSAFAGEICVCVDQAQRMARELGTTPADELLLYLVHGWLHLAGLDDIEERDRAEMRAAEATALELLRGAGLAPLKSAAFPQEKI